MRHGGYRDPCAGWRCVVSSAMTDFGNIEVRKCAHLRSRGKVYDNCTVRVGRDRRRNGVTNIARQSEGMCVTPVTRGHRCEFVTIFVIRRVVSNPQPIRS